MIFCAASASFQRFGIQPWRSVRQGASGGFDFKDASSAIPSMLDGLDKRFGFGAHFDTHFSGKLRLRFRSMEDGASARALQDNKIGPGCKRRKAQARDAPWATAKLRREPVSVRKENQSRGRQGRSA